MNVKEAVAAVAGVCFWSIGLVCLIGGVNGIEWAFGGLTAGLGLSGMVYGAFDFE